ncbi:zinc finger CCCH domain-containing protein 43-like isoform X3 [Olea europaea var. sylvestris]|uniref:Zinc finger CCCH domain-containing 67 isoform X2 n=1 Tax=Olea europaea subsp. europaea TaxID=158383 RepID=A0A8S0PEF0_OLEEU|nr:zinc finger CCCH domain-containing protein 43-like isoform X3 [Olea europaea var. sylvestris]CAA2939580.1 zinc finger CCCH domain-containing 67 isoform X2 [Olea europaea subsp. europaea]
MDSSESSIFEKPQNGNLGLGLINPESTPIDPISDQGGEKEVFDPQNAPEGKNDLPKGIDEEVKEKAVEEEEVKLRDAIEREIHQLTLEQAEIEAAWEEGPGLNDDYKEGNEVRTAENENVDGAKGVEYEVNENQNKEKDGQDVQNWEDEDRNGGYDENESSGEEYEGEGKSMEESVKGGMNIDYNSRKPQYPLRPDAEDCSFYMKTGSCKFGSGCKFNHPSRRKHQDVKERENQREGNPERAGQIECKYYLTSGGCKYGKACKYYHGTGRSPITPILKLNFLGLPIRTGEKECTYYMRNGSCKYGSNCRFHHPEPTAEPGGNPPPGYSNGGSLPPQGFFSSSTSSWSPPKALNETASVAPLMLPATQVIPSPNPEWNGYEAANYPSSERSLPTPPAFSMSLPTNMNFPFHHQQEMVIEEYPERPGEPECSFFLKTGDCKYKSNCKFHHPKKRYSKPMANPCTLNDKGLPLRPLICSHYSRFGICKYGPGCKFDHPAKFAISQPPPYDRPPFNSQNS